METSVKDAQNYLKKANWRLDMAIDTFYNNPPASATVSSGSSKPADPKKISALFDQYREKGSCAIPAIL